MKTTIWAKSGIYRIDNTVTGECYVGSAVNLGDRKGGHFHRLRHGTHHSAYMQRSYKKHGEEAFVFSVIEFLPREAEILRERETYWIQTLKPRYNGTTITATRLGAKCTPEQVERIRQARNSPEVRAKLSKALTGRKRTPEARQRMSDWQKGRKVSEEVKANLLRYASQPHSAERNKKKSEREVTAETRRKMSEKAALRTHSDASKQKMREAKLGTTQSEETKRKRSESLTGRIVSEEARSKSSESNKQAWANKTEQELADFSFKARNRPPISEETRRKQSEAKKGRKPSDALMKASIARHTGAKRSEETRAKMRISNKAAAERRKASKQQEIVEGVTQYKMFG